MAADKGKQYEYSICLAAWKQVGYANLSPTLQREYMKYDSLIEDEDVRQAGDIAINEIKKEISNPQWLTFESKAGRSKFGGEPKTDILFNGNIKVSVKWEDKGWQLTSGNPRFTYETMANALANAYEQGDMSITDYNVIKMLIDSYDKAFSRVGTQVSRNIDSVLDRNQELTKELSGVLGSGHKPGKIYEQFNHAVVKEALTGEILFGGGVDAANYVLGNLSGFHKIDDKLVKVVAKYYKTRIASKKGRGKDRATGTRRNEIAGRMEITASSILGLVNDIKRI
tara:strand:+ start:62 stop:910 length:849 start_codon:yes stop_codon:yes gene_type:complete